MASPSFWFVTLITLVISLVPDMSIAALRKSKKHLQRYWWDMNRSRARRKNSSYNVQVTRISGSFEMEAASKHNVKTCAYAYSYPQASTVNASSYSRVVRKNTEDKNIVKLTSLECLEGEPYLVTV
jgi:hypothetical protein